MAGKEVPEMDQARAARPPQAFPHSHTHTQVQAEEPKIFSATPKLADTRVEPVPDPARDTGVPSAVQDWTAYHEYYRATHPQCVVCQAHYAAWGVLHH